MPRAKFRYKSSLKGIGYNRQGVIYFISQLYRELPREKQAEIRRMCQEAGGEHWKAVFERVTTGREPGVICMEHYLSESTLERKVREYYRLFAENEKMK